MAAGAVPHSASSLFPPPPGVSPASAYQHQRHVTRVLALAPSVDLATVVQSRQEVGASVLSAGEAAL